MTDRWGGVPCRDSNQQWYFPNSSLIARCARCSRYTVVGMNYTATLNMVDREMSKEMNFDCLAFLLCWIFLLFMLTKYCSQVVKEATFYESNTYGNDVSQKSCSFPSPFISEGRNNYPLWRLFICFFTRFLAFCFKKLFSFRCGWYIFWVRFIIKWIIITILKALGHKSYNSHMM